MKVCFFILNLRFWWEILCKINIKITGKLTIYVTYYFIRVKGDIFSINKISVANFSFLKYVKCKIWDYKFYQHVLLIVFNAFFSFII